MKLLFGYDKEVWVANLHDKSWIILIVLIDEFSSRKKKWAPFLFLKIQSVFNRATNDNLPVVLPDEETL